MCTHNMSLSFLGLYSCLTSLCLTHTHNYSSVHAPPVLPCLLTLRCSRRSRIFHVCSFFLTSLFIFYHFSAQLRVSALASLFVCSPLLSQCLLFSTFYYLVFLLAISISVSPAHILSFSCMFFSRTFPLLLRIIRPLSLLLFLLPSCLSSLSLPLVCDSHHLWKMYPNVLVVLVLSFQYRTQQCSSLPSLSFSSLSFSFSFPFALRLFCVCHLDHLLSLFCRSCVFLSFRILARRPMNTNITACSILHGTLRKHSVSMMLICDYGGFTLTQEHYRYNKQLILPAKAILLVHTWRGGWRGQTTGTWHKWWWTSLDRQRDKREEYRESRAQRQKSADREECDDRPSVCRTQEKQKSNAWTACRLENEDIQQLCEMWLCQIRHRPYALLLMQLCDCCTF